MTVLDTSVKKTERYKKYQKELVKYKIAALVKNIFCDDKEIKRIKIELESKVKEFKSINVLVVQLDAEVQGVRLLLNDKSEQYVKYE
ncbi:MAG: hypothetical protein LBL77_01360 [Endomicrobium sp.]|jgi:chromosome segregation ATPase|nr:hypothetical protein [Endomicrobium sp.]